MGGPIRSHTKQQIVGLALVAAAMIFIMLYFAINPTGVAFTYYNYPIYLFQGFYVCT